MGKENGFVPIDEANTERINFSLDLPAYIDRKRVFVNSDRLEGLMNLGGINNLRVEGYESARSESEKIEIVHSEDTDSGYCSPQRSLVVRVDVGKLIGNSASIRSHTALGKELDTATKHGIRESASSVLLLDNPIHDKLFLAFFAVDQLIRNIDSPDLVDILESYGLIGLCAGVAYQLPLSKGKHRFSLTLGPQLDREILLQLRTRLQTLIQGSDDKP